MDRDVEHGQALTGGNASGRVTRIDRTVRKSWTPATPYVHDYMRHVRMNGADAPATYGKDPGGRQAIEYIDGPLAIEAPALTRDDLHRVGSIVRAIHDASRGFAPSDEVPWQSAIPAPGAELVCHNDLAPWNLVLGDRWVFIDWDAAAPSTRLWDLAYAAQTFTLGAVDAPVEQAAADLRAFVDGYDPDPDLRIRLPRAMDERTSAMLELLTTSNRDGIEPWASMFMDGHGSHWAGVVDYVRTNQRVWLDALMRSDPSRD